MGLGLSCSRREIDTYHFCVDSLQNEWFVILSFYSMNVVVVGAGYWGPNVVRNLTRFPEVERIGIVDMDPAKAQAVAFQFPRTRVEPSFEEALRAGYGAAVIVTPVLTHAPLAKQALEAGLHVLIEKPITRTNEEASELLRLAQEKGLTLMAGHVFHYKPAVRKMVELIQRGDIGEICYLDSVRVNLGLFRPDVNVLWDLAPHDLTIFEAILGRRDPVAISAQGAQHVTHPVKRQETMVYMTLDYGNDVLGHIHVNWFSPLKQRQMVVAGSKQMIVYDDIDTNEPLRVYDCGTYDPKLDTPMYPQIRSGDVHVPYVQQQEPLYLQMKEFLSAIREGRAPETDGQAGWRIVRMLEVAMESLQQGGKLISFS